ncbi:MAG TPA: hypothetical protein PL033_09600 [Candidatus Brocadiia bacterium]|nr:hypothetical protein [Candidatus Brocadiia bacterium]
MATDNQPNAETGTPDPVRDSRVALRRMATYILYLENHRADKRKLLKSIAQLMGVVAEKARELKHRNMEGLALVAQELCADLAARNRRPGRNTRTLLVLVNESLWHFAEKDDAEPFATRVDDILIRIRRIMRHLQMTGETTFEVEE